MHESSAAIPEAAPAAGWPAPGQDPAVIDHAPAFQTHRFRFTGSGAEYFKIWMVNLFLSVITLGIYSAWAKVRRLQYFDRNTELAGAVFDFDGNPIAIFRGRVLAVILLGAYQYAFGFSFAVGLAVVLMLLASLPFLMRGALRFRLRNTRYRGLRFAFSGSPAGAYAAYLPPLLMFLLPAVLVALDPSGKTVLYVFLLYLVWPLMHGAMKRYQHKHLQYGSLASSFDVNKRRFYIPYLKSIGIALLAFTAAGVICAVGLVVAKSTGWLGRSAVGGVFFGVVVGLSFGYISYLLAGPYLQVRVGNLAWSATTLPGVTISSHLKARSYLKLQLVNSVLTLLTLGLYRPFAVVRAYRYRLEHITITTVGSFEHAVAGVANNGSASADGVADFLGVDLSW
jgi:uncharacterized membrane protein YjgN (DUF898 family)